VRWCEEPSLRITLRGVTAIVVFIAGCPVMRVMVLVVERNRCGCDGEAQSADGGGCGGGVESHVTDTFHHVKGWLDDCVLCMDVFFCVCMSV